MASDSLRAIRKELRSLGDPGKAAELKRFFKTGPGEYAEGDRFIGVGVPQVRALARKHRGVSFKQAEALLSSPVHEERLLGLLVLVDAFESGDDARRKTVFGIYLNNTRRINNWDLVDLSAYRIVGEYLRHKPKTVLRRLAASQDVWERRIAIVSTFADIKAGDPRPAFAIARMLLHDRHDLIHKAAGWMLRESGKRCSQQKEESFLRRHHRAMPRTMLRYAIERFPETLRLKFLSGTV